MTVRQIELYKDAAGSWRWRVRAANGSDILSDSGQGYSDRGEAREMAREVVSDSIPFADDLAEANRWIEDQEC